MKKLLALVAAAFISSPVFAAPAFLPDIYLSAGGGGIFNMHWRNSTLESRFLDYQGRPVRPYGMAPTEPTLRAMDQGLFNTRDLTAGGGIFGFFDATLATLGVGLVFNNVGQILDVPHLPDVDHRLGGEELREFTVTQLNLSLLLRYPFALRDRLSIFPMLGIDGQIALGDFNGSLRAHFQSVANEGYEVPTMGQFWNSMWIRFGAGADFGLRGNLFLRGELLYGFKLNSSHESRMSSYWRSGVSNGIHVRLAVGHTFHRLSLPGRGRSPAPPPFVPTVDRPPDIHGTWHYNGEHIFTFRTTGTGSRVDRDLDFTWTATANTLTFSGTYDGHGFSVTADWRIVESYLVIANPRAADDSETSFGQAEAFGYLAERPLTRNPGDDTQEDLY